MNDIPHWLTITWLVLSSIFFMLNIGIFVALLLMAFKMMQMMKDVSPKVNAIAERVEGIASNVEHIAENTKSTVENVSGHAQSMMGSMDTIAVAASKQFEKFSPAIAIGMTGLKLWKTYKQKNRPAAKPKK